MNDLTPRVPERSLIWPEVVFNLQTLFIDTQEDIYIVGGAVRDALMHRPLKDVDLATSGSGIRVARKIANHFHGDFFVLDAERDVGRALIDTPSGKLTLDVARLRGEALFADLTDRDFTLNAMAVNLHGNLGLLIDPLHGEIDINRKVLRRCSPDSLANDPIRALRAVRQSVQLSLRIEPETLSDIRRVGPMINSISPERVRDEFIKILSLPKPATALRVADTVGLLAIVLPETAPLHGMKQSPPHIYDGWTHTLSVVENMSNILAVIDYSRSDNLAASFSMGIMAMQLDRYRASLREHIHTMWPNDRPHRALLILAALLHDIGKPRSAQQDDVGRWRFLGHETIGAEMAEARVEALRLSNAEQDRLVTTVRNHMRPLLLEQPTPRAIHRFWRQTGQAGIDICLLSIADYLGTFGPNLDQDAWLVFVDRIRLLLDAYFERYDSVVSPPSLIDGNQLIQTLKLKPGPIIGELLDLIREAQVIGDVASLEEALQLARSHLESKN